MFLYYRGVNPNVAVNGNVKFVDISERRSKRVKDIFVPFSEQLTALEKQKTWFQQDGATAHTARATMTAVSKVFGERVISRD